MSIGSAGSEFPRTGFLDRQRQEMQNLVGHLSVCLDSLALGDGSSAEIRREYFWKLNDLFEAAIVHFRCEEEWLAAVCYPFLAEHQMEHGHFIEKMSEALLLANEKPIDPTTVKYAADWIGKHERKSDGNHAE